jgi:hypothetical protein
VKGHYEFADRLWKGTLRLTWSFKKSSSLSALRVGVGRFHSAVMRVDLRHLHRPAFALTLKRITAPRILIDILEARHCIEFVIDNVEVHHRLDFCCWHLKRIIASISVIDI